ncbi:hypothetical protein ABZT49_16035 [Methylobacterium sp. EM32]|uniref:hypothetical protein n=1 Tax=Methylobacterium sp. EM32 TaxID=3163481 RepID=UPI0033A8A7FD
MPGPSPTATAEPIFEFRRLNGSEVIWSDYVALFHPPESGAVCVMAYQAEVAKGEYRTRNAGAKGSEVVDAVRAHRPRFHTLCGFRETVPAWARRKGLDYREAPCKAEWNLASLGSLWIELDYYNKPRLKGLSAEDMAAMVLDRVAERDLPQPSMLVSSGKGLYGIWRHEPLAPYGKHGALAIWKATQKALNDHFVDFGRDIAAMSPTTNLRVAGSRNDGKTVRVVWPMFADMIGRHSFADLKAQILPYTAEQVKAHREAKAAAKAVRKAAKVAKQAAAIAAGEPPKPVPAFKLNRGTFQRAVQRDLEALFHDRFGGRPVPQGSRDLWLYTLTCAAAWLLDPAALRDEVRRLAPLCGLAPRRALVLMGAVLRNADRSAAGKTRTHKGRSGCDYRYRTNPRRLVDEFGVTVEDAERLDLRVLVPRSLKASRTAERAAAYRKRKGAKPRTDVQAGRLAFGQWALEQHSAGVRVDELAFQAKARFVTFGSKSWVEKAMREARAVAIGKPQRKGVPGQPRKVPVEAATAPEKNPYGSSRSISGLDKAAAPIVAGKRASYDASVTAMHLITAEARAALSRDRAALDVPEGCDPLHLGQYVLANGQWYRWDFERQTSYPVHAGAVQYDEHDILGVPLDQELYDAWQADIDRRREEVIAAIVAEREAGEAAARGAAEREVSA